jgi:GNAT superfamily N-acetyltransferase
VSDITVKALTPALAGDFLRFFDHERGSAFADNPEWAKCYCHFYEVPVALEWPSLSAAQNRTAMQARIEVGEMEGFLAFAGGEPVGWLNAQPRHKLSHCFDRMRVPPTPLPCAAYEAAVIVCFIIAPAWRRRGVSRALLASALSSLAARGFRLVDAFPFKSGDSERAADHYHGALSTFIAAGFAPLAETDAVTVVRKFLR